MKPFDLKLPKMKYCGQPEIVLAKPARETLEPCLTKVENYIIIYIVYPFTINSHIYYGKVSKFSNYL
jgi:hypothetical protein